MHLLLPNFHIHHSQLSRVMPNGCVCMDCNLACDVLDTGQLMQIFSAPMSLPLLSMTHVIQSH